MTALSPMQEAIAVVAIGCAILSFLVYLAFSYKAVTSEANKKVEESLRDAVGSVKEFTPPTAKEVAELVKGLASLAESLVKAGPALWSMIGSALFLLIAALAAGVFWGSPPAKTDPNSSPGTEAAQNQMGTENENMPVTSNTAAR